MSRKIPKNKQIPSLGNVNLQKLVQGGAFKNTLASLGGASGATQALGQLLLQNQDKFVAGIEYMEQLHKESLDEGEYEGIMYSFAVVDMEGKKKLAVMALPYNSEKQTFGTPVQVQNLGDFINSLTQSAIK
jgi:hypothetical protein